MGVQFSRSLKQNSQFRRLYRRGKSATGRCLVIYCRPNGTKENQIGITVNAKLGCAVVRNRARRRLREVYRLNETRLKSGYDIVIVARHAAATAPFDQLQADFLSLCAQLSLLAEEG